MKIIFSEDYCGRETAMKEYKAGDEAELSAEMALALIRLGAAIEAEPTKKRNRRKEEEE